MPPRDPRRQTALASARPQQPSRPQRPQRTVRPARPLRGTRPQRPSARPQPRRRPGAYGAGAYRAAATQRLRQFRRQSALAVALTGLILVLWGAADVPAQEIVAPIDTAVVQQDADTLGVAAGAVQGAEEATGTVRELVRGFYRILPALVIAFAILLMAALLSKLVRPVLRRLLASFDRAEAIAALAGIAIWIVALGAALSVMAGDVRALLGSVGLVGLALSWALQAPIESFTGWLLNSFRGYYRVGDRILVGEVFGDVWRIDFLTTTVWEAGGPGKPVQGAQPTGALITFPNSEVLRANITNFTRLFPYVWDEVVIGVTGESDLAYALDVMRDVAERTFGDTMREPAAAYVKLLERAGLGFDVATEPQIFVTQAEAWMDITVRYMVPARERRRWASELQVAMAVELAKEEHRGRVASASPLTRVVLQEPGTTVGAT